MTDSHARVNRVQRMARALCFAEGYVPTFVVRANPNSMTQFEPHEMWTQYERKAEILLETLDAMDEEERTR